MVSSACLPPLLVLNCSTCTHLWTYSYSPSSSRMWIVQYKLCVNTTGLATWFSISTWLFVISFFLLVMIILSSWNWWHRTGYMISTPPRPSRQCCLMHSRLELLIGLTMGICTDWYTHAGVLCPPPPLPAPPLNIHWPLKSVTLLCLYELSLKAHSNAKSWVLNALSAQVCTQLINVTCLYS